MTKVLGFQKEGKVVAIPLPPVLKDNVLENPLLEH